jgi:hypothetical protein
MVSGAVDFTRQCHTLTTVNKFRLIFNQVIDIILFQTYQLLDECRYVLLDSLNLTLILHTAFSSQQDHQQVQKTIRTVSRAG